jgi:Na+-translocating ferredoxin:NAD+ oxidoreductase RnfE subunit
MNSIIPNAGIVVEVLRGIQIGLAIFALFCLVMAIRELIGISRLQKHDDNLDDANKNKRNGEID